MIGSSLGQGRAGTRGGVVAPRTRHRPHRVALLAELPPPGQARSRFNEYSVDYRKATEVDRKNNAFLLSGLLPNRYNQHTCDAVWFGFVEYILVTLLSGKGVLIPGFAKFSFKRDPVDKKLVPIFVLSNHFMDHYKVEQRHVPAGANIKAVHESEISYFKVALAAPNSISEPISKDMAQEIMQRFITILGEKAYVMKSNFDIEFGFGTLFVKEGTVSFKFSDRLAHHLTPEGHIGVIPTARTSASNASDVSSVPTFRSDFTSISRKLSKGLRADKAPQFDPSDGQESKQSKAKVGGKKGVRSVEKPQTKPETRSAEQGEEDFDLLSPRSQLLWETRSMATSDITSFCGSRNRLGPRKSMELVDSRSKRSGGSSDITANLKSAESSVYSGTSKVTSRLTKPPSSKGTSVISSYIADQRQRDSVPLDIDLVSRESSDATSVATSTLTDTGKLKRRKSSLARANKIVPKLWNESDPTPRYEIPDFNKDKNPKKVPKGPKFRPNVYVAQQKKKMQENKKKLEEKGRPSFEKLPDPLEPRPVYNPAPKEGLKGQDSQVCMGLSSGIPDAYETTYSNIYNENALSFLKREEEALQAETDLFTRSMKLGSVGRPSSAPPGKRHGLDSNRSTSSSASRQLRGLYPHRETAEEKSATFKKNFRSNMIKEKERRAKEFRNRKGTMEVLFERAGENEPMFALWGDQGSMLYVHEPRNLSRGMNNDSLVGSGVMSCAPVNDFSELWPVGATGPTRTAKHSSEIRELQKAVKY